MDRSLTLIGLAPAEGATALAEAMMREPGPPVLFHRAGSVALLAEPAERGGRLALLRRGKAGLLAGLHRLQRRLEIGCQMGPFLPFDPAAAACPEADLPRLLEGAAEPLAAALQARGRRHQWDVILRWQPEPVLARRLPRSAAPRARAALAEAVAAAL
ncbi:hypothetical protein E2C05_26545, partial [Paracraurococcus ruber]